MTRAVVIDNVTICYDPTEEIRRENNGEPRWCFRCRKVRVFEFIVRRPIDPESYYGPHWGIYCGTCGLNDGDLFPGRIREWDEA